MKTQSNETAASLYWHDYETFGTDTRRDRPVQFAGLRTDHNLNIISDPLVIYCKPANDYLPHPEACLITGITPQKALQEGLPETEFMQLILDEFSQANTCSVGYNSIRFDDEITRNTLFRNLYDPYAREWQNGNSRWDIIDLVRLTYALRPEGIQWPLNEDGKPSFRLEALTQANDIAHESAHDALSDVLASIEMAKLIKSKQPKLYDYVFNHRSKKNVSALLNIESMKPVLHTSGMISPEFGCTALVAPLIPHPLNPNGVVVYDLRYDPNDLINLPADEIRRRLYTPKTELAEGEEKIALKTLHINKCPIIIPAKIDEKTEQRLQINKQQSRLHLEQLRNTSGLRAKLLTVFDDNPFKKETDPDFSLYSGPFISNDDKAIFTRIHRSDPFALVEKTFNFKDARFNTLFFRYRARNYPQTLTAAEAQQWEEFRQTRLQDESQNSGLTFKQFYAICANMLNSNVLSEKQKALIRTLEDYVKSIDNSH